MDKIPQDFSPQNAQNYVIWVKNGEIHASENRTTGQHIKNWLGRFLCNLSFFTGCSYKTSKIWDALNKENNSSISVADKARLLPVLKTRIENEKQGWKTWGIRNWHDRDVRHISTGIQGQQTNVSTMEINTRTVHGRGTSILSSSSANPVERADAPISLELASRGLLSISATQPEDLTISPTESGDYQVEISYADLSEAELIQKTLLQQHIPEVRLVKISGQPYTVVRIGAAGMKNLSEFLKDLDKPHSFGG